MGSNYLKKSIFIIVLFALSSLIVSLFDNNSNLKVENEVYNIMTQLSIMHHISDAHDWHLWG